jgi:hypothetical protein
VSGDRKSGIPAAVDIPAPVWREVRLGSSGNRVEVEASPTYHDHYSFGMVLDVLGQTFDISKFQGLWRDTLIHWRGGFVAHASLSLDELLM